MDDAYNANPESMRAALKALVAMGNRERRTWAVIGEMRELGDIRKADGGRVGIQSLPAASPFAQLKPGENLVLVHTDLQAAFGNDLAAATNHYTQYGYREGRATTAAPAFGKAACTCGMATPPWAAAAGTCAPTQLPHSPTLANTQAMTARVMASS